METKMNTRRAAGIRIKLGLLGFDHCFVVDYVSKSGGLMLLWKNSISVVIQNYSRRHINAVVQDSLLDPAWKFTGFYGHPDVARRGELWALLRYLARLHPDHWLCLGDFNEIITASEKSSKSIRPTSQMQAFQNDLSDCKLTKLGFTGPKFTWWNGRHGREHTMERLDRAEANREWCALYNITEVEVLPRTTSDHHPIQVSFSNSQNTRWPKTSGFLFEAEWTKNKEHGAVIKQVWHPKKRWERPWQTIQSNL
jgi:hypothetical protein